MAIISNWRNIYQQAEFDETMCEMLDISNPKYKIEGQPRTRIQPGSGL